MYVAFEQLLEIQQLDATLAQLVHRRAELPARAEISRLTSELQANEKQAATLQSERDGVARAQKRYEDEVATVEAKIAGINDKLYGGSITAPKEAQTLQEEIAAFGRHQASIEDHVIEQMELAEPLDAKLATLAAAAQTLQASLDDANVQLLAAEAEIDVEIDAVTVDRSVRAADVPADMLTKYEQARPEFGQSSIVVLEGSNCRGCPMAMSAMDVDRAKKMPEDEMYSCQECGRFVVK